MSVFILTLGMQSVWSDAKSPVNGDIWRVPPRRLPRLSMRPSSRSKSFGSRLTIGDGNTNMSCTIHKFHKFHKTHTQFKKEGYFFRHFFLTSFWLLAPSASGFWLVASGFWLHFSMEGIFFWRLSACFFKEVFVFSVWGSFPSYLLHFGAKISDLRAICCILELKYPIWPSALGFWFWLHLALGFWFLISVGFLALVSLGFWLWLLAALLLNVCVVL